MKRSETLGIASLFAVYILWGSTFLGIRLAVETIPPWIAAFGRHGFGGVTLALGLFLCGQWSKPRLQETLNACLIGVLTAGLSNGALMLAEVTVPSSYAAIAFTTMPLFMLLMNWQLFEKVIPSKLDFLALPLGLLGIFEITLLIFCPAIWAFGSLLGRKIPMPQNILVSASLQMMSGALFLLILSLIHGDWTHFSLSAVTARSFWGILYLAVGGSLLGFTAFALAIRNLDPRIVGTYAIVNPIIAVALGFLFGENVRSPMTLLGIFISIGSVALSFILQRLWRAGRLR